MLFKYLTEAERDTLYERCPEIWAKLFEIEQIHRRRNAPVQRRIKSNDKYRPRCLFPLRERNNAAPVL